MAWTKGYLSSTWSLQRHLDIATKLNDTGFITVHGLSKGHIAIQLIGPWGILMNF